MHLAQIMAAGRDDPLVPLTDDSSDEEVPPTAGTNTAPKSSGGGGFARSAGQPAVQRSGAMVSTPSKGPFGRSCIYLIFHLIFSEVRESRYSKSWVPALLLLLQEAVVWSPDSLLNRWIGCSPFPLVPPSSPTPGEFLRRSGGSWSCRARSWRG